MDGYAEKLGGIEKRVSTLEQQREADLKAINENNKNLAVIVEKLESIADKMTIITDNLEKTKKEEHRLINDRLSRLEETVYNLKEKQELDTDTLEKELNDRTTVKNSNDFDAIKRTITTVIITAIVSAMVTALISIMK